MKKLLLTLTVLTLLAGCSETSLMVETPMEETPTEETSEKVMAPQPFYIKNLSLDSGVHVLEQGFVTWLSESEGTCRTNGDVMDEGSSIPECNPNGFLLVEREGRLVTAIPSETPVTIINLATILALDSGEADAEGYYQITVEELMKAFEANPDFFAVTPFELGYGTVVIDGLEMSDQVSSINEIYIP